VSVLFRTHNLEAIICSAHSRYTPLTEARCPATGQLVGDEPVAELRVSGVDADNCVDQVRVISIPVPDQVGAQLRDPWVEKRSSRQVTVTGTPSPTRSNLATDAWDQ
jgi:hypothetical protein